MINTRLYYVTVLSLFLFIPPVFGQDANLENSDVFIDTITVTAQKRQEDIQDIPMSVSAFSDVQIADAAIIIRGISNDADFIHSTTGLYVDDIGYSMNFMHNPGLFDIERIEILRGPQGTLYGRNSESGVINIVTRQPDNYRKGKVYTELGAYDPDHGAAMSYKAGVSFSGPVINDRFYMGVAGEIETSDGYIFNTYSGDDEAGSIEHKNIRLNSRWTPSASLEISATLDFLTARDGNGNKRYIEGPWKTAAHEINYDTNNNVNDQDMNGQTLKIKYKGDNFDLLSITGRRFYENHMMRDGLTSPINDGNNDLLYSSDQISEEIRITSPEKIEQFQWLGGVYLFKEKNVTDIDIPFFKEIRNTDMNTQGYALFGQGTITFFQRLHLTAGLRYNYDDMEGDMDYYGTSHYTFGSSFSDNVLLPKFSAAYDLTPEIMAYSTAARGYNGGGFNTAYAKNSNNFMYSPEFTWNYELGLKSAWLNNRLNANLAMFYISIDDKQVAELNGITDVMMVRNAAKAHSQGFELEIHARPFSGLDLFAGLGYTDIEFDKWTTPRFDYAGNKLPNAPEVTANIGIQYRHASGFFGRVDLIGTDSFYSDARNTQKIDGKRLINLRAGYETEKFDVILWCKNLLNEEYQTMGFARRYDQVVDGKPRMFGITLAYYF